MGTRYVRRNPANSAASFAGKRVTLGLADLVAELGHRWQGRQTGRFVHKAFVEAKHFVGLRGHT
jgi:hypothetical protein